MRYIKIFFLSCVIFIGKNKYCFGKDYSHYYSQINTAEEFFLNNDVPQCFKTYDHVFAEYSKPFVKDCYIAAQIAFSAGDTLKFMAYLELAFKNGMPIGALEAAPMLKGISHNEPLYYRILNTYSINYVSSNVDIQKTDSLKKIEYYCDSLKVVYGKSRSTDSNAAIAFIAGEEFFRNYVYENYISKGVFPLEKITGIKTDTTDDHFLKKYGKVDLYPREEMAKSFNGGILNVTIVDSVKTEYDLSNTLAFNIFIHYTCTMSRYSTDLWQCVLNGYLHPKDYGMLEEMSVSWNRRGPFSKYSKQCSYDKKDAYYNILPPDPGKMRTFVEDETLIKKVEENRAQHLMQKYSLDVQKKKLEKEKGFKFIFGFMDFR